MFKAAIAAQGPKLVEKVKGVIVYVITAGPNNKRWTFYTDLKNGEGKVGEGRVKKVRGPAVPRTIRRKLLSQRAVAFADDSSWLTRNSHRVCWGGVCTGC